MLFQPAINYVNMANNKKTFCPKHSFYYSGHNCPFCVKERSESYARRFNTVNESDREPSNVELAALMDKYNNKNYGSV